MAGLRGLTLGDARLYAVSVDSPETNRTFIEKLEADGKGRIRFSLLSDPGSATIDRYGLRDPAYAGSDYDGIPHPAVFVIDGKGTVRWARIEKDYRQRPALSEVQKALDAVK